jgi:hypothetical protein
MQWRSENRAQTVMAPDRAAQASVGQTPTHQYGKAAAIEGVRNA